MGLSVALFRILTNIGDPFSPILDEGIFLVLQEKKNILNSDLKVFTTLSILNGNTFTLFPITMLH